MPSPHVLVTGASSGIGRACALALRGRGFTVHGSVRSADDAASLEADDIEPVVFDVTDDDAVAAGIAHVRDRAAGNLRAVVANAGIAATGPLEDVTTEELRHQLDVNVLGVHRTVAPLIDDLCATQGRIVLMSSVSGRIAIPMAGAYNASKFALEGYGDALRRELAPHGVEVVLVEPGQIATPIWDKSTPSDEDFDALDERYATRARKLAKGMLRNARSAPPPEAVAEVVVEALTVRHPRPRYALPRDSRVMAAVLPRLPDRLADRVIASQLPE